MADFPIALTNAVDNETDVLAKHINNLEAKVGINSSAVVSSHDYKIGVLETNNTGSNTGDQDISGILTNASNITGILSKTDFITVSQEVDLDTMESNIATNNEKVGITTSQANAILANSSKISFSWDYDYSDLINKPSIPSTGVDFDPVGTDNSDNNAVNTLYSGLATSKQDSLVSGTNIKTVNSQSLLGSGNIVISGGGAVDSVNTYTGAVVLDADDLLDTSTTNKFVTAADITKLSNLSGTNTGDETAASIKTLLGITTLSGSNTGDQDISGISANASSIDDIEAKTDFITISQSVDLDTMESNIATNNSKVGITSEQASAIAANTAKVSFVWDYDYADLINKPTTITPTQASDITANNAKVSYDDASDVALNTTHRGLTNNPHSVDKADVGLSNVPNLSFSGSNTGDQASYDFDIKDLADSTSLKATWNAKQNALTADTDYLTPGTASSTYEPLLGFTPYNSTNPNGYTSNVGDMVKSADESISGRKIFDSGKFAMDGQVEGAANSIKGAATGDHTYYNTLPGKDGTFAMTSDITGINSGTNTGDQDLSSLALKTNVLELDNTTAFTPDSDYEPSTKKYVDDETDTPGATSFNKLKSAPTTYIDNGNTAWDDYYIGGEGSLDTSSYVTGTGSIKVTTQTRNVYNGVSLDLSSSPVTITGKEISLYVKSSDWSKIDQCNLILSQDGYTLSKTYTLDLNTRLQNQPDDEWIEIIVPKSAFTVDGAPTWSTINLILLRVKDGGTQADISLDSISSFDKGYGGLVSVTFDDGYDDVCVEGKKKLDQYGYKATAYVIPGLLGETGYLTQAQVDCLSRDGWDISGHGNNNLTTFTDAQLQEDLRTTKEYLSLHGYRGADQYAYPNGAWSEHVNSYVSKYFGTGANIDGWNNSLTNLSPYRINRQSIDKYTTTAMVQGWIDDAIDNDEWLILNFHTLVTTMVDGQDWLISYFGTIVDYLDSSNANVKTVSSVLENNNQERLISSKNIKTINSTSLLGSGNIVISGSSAVDSVNGETGVVVLDADDISDTSTTNKFVTSTDITNLSNLSGNNSGDETATSIKTALGISTLSGSNTGDQTTITGNAGSATVLQTARTIAGVSFNGSANISLNNNAITNGAGYTASALPLAGGTMTGDIQLGETDIKLDATLSADGKWSGITMAGTAGATLAVGDICYLASTGKWLLNDGILDGTDTGFSKQLGMCVKAATNTNATEMLVYGKIRSATLPTLTVGSAVYLSDTAGDVVVTQPSTANFAIRKVGYAITAEDLFFNPSNDYIVHT